MRLRRSPRRGPHGAAIPTWKPVCFFPSRPTSLTCPGPVNDPGHSDSLVMMATVNASIANAPATTSAMAAASEVSAGRANPHCGRQDRRGELSAMGWNERRRVVLLLHEYALGRACQDRRMRERSTARAWRASIRTTRAGCPTRRSCSENELRRESPQNCSGGERFSGQRGQLQFYE